MEVKIAVTLQVERQEGMNASRQDVVNAIIDEGDSFDLTQLLYVPVMDGEHESVYEIVGIEIGEVR